MVTKSIAKRLDAMQKHKQPKVPVFPPSAQTTYDKALCISTEGGPMAWVAYGIMSRMSVLYAANTDAFDNEKMMAAMLTMVNTLSAYVDATTST